MARFRLWSRFGSGSADLVSCALSSTSRARVPLPPWGLLRSRLLLGVLPPRAMLRYLVLGVLPPWALLRYLILGAFPPRGLLRYLCLILGVFPRSLLRFPWSRLRSVLTRLWLGSRTRSAFPFFTLF